MERLKSVLKEDFDWSHDPRSLRDSYKRKNFDPIFLKLIAKNVIKILSPQQVAEPHNLIYDEELVYDQLIGPLEKFICDLDESATEEDVREALVQIQTFNQPSKICHRILKIGDVTFSCNDCGLDGTCVVCIDCFHKGAHKDHNYKMSNSAGGCCDCGDVEAWKQNYACSDHMADNQANLKLSDFEDRRSRAEQVEADKNANLEKINRLPKSIAAKYFMVCQASLHYARMMISWDNYKSLPTCLELSVEDVDSQAQRLSSKDAASKNYFTVLFNDEVHTYDHVINTLVKVIKCTKMTASIIASTVSREGRSYILNDTILACKQVKDMIANVRDAGSSPLKVEVIHSTILAHQAFALKLIEWIQRMSSICDAFRILTAYTLLGPFDSLPEREDNADITLLEKIILSNTTYWKIARVEWNDLFVTTLLTEYSIKEQFARLLTRIYPKLMQDFIQDDHDHSVSILTLTTQLYTVPSLICMLIEEEDALKIIFRTLIDTCKSRKRENPSISFENRNTFDMQGLKRGFYTINDLRSLINIQPTKWTDQLRKNVIEAVKVFLELLCSMQGMDSVKRQLGQHLEYEPDWESGMTLQSRLVMLITRIVAYCSYDEEVLVATLKETLSWLSKKSNGGYKMVSRELLNRQVSCIQYDVSTSPVSVHLPLSRFAAALIIELMKRRPSDKVPYDESLVILDKQSDVRPKLSMVDIMEPSLRTEVMIAQFRSGMWRRNGYSLVNQIMYFHGASMRKEMFDRDILVLQECAAMLDPDEFMIHLLNKFQLFTWISSETTRDPLASSKSVSFYNDEEIMNQTMSLGEEFLQLLLTIICERYRIGVGVIEEDDVIKNEIIQILCISPSTRSDLTQRLHVADNEIDCIKAVANLKRSTEASTGKYELKDEFYERFNPFFYHYSRRNQSMALDAQLKRKKNLKESLICCPPPTPVKLTSQFSNLNGLLKCDIMITLIKKILTRAIGPSTSPQECSTKAIIRFNASDLQLDQSLHLIGYGLLEQERAPLEFKYLQAAYDKDIFQLLRECYEKAKRSKDLIFWLMKKTNQLIENLNSNYKNSLDEKTTFCLGAIQQCLIPTLSTCDTKQDSKTRSSELAAQRRERIMAMMKANQDKFLSSPYTKQLVVDTEKNEGSQKTAKVSGSPQAAPSSSNQTSSAYTTRCGTKRVSFNTESSASSAVRNTSNPDASGNFEMDYDVDDETVIEGKEEVSMEEEVTEQPQVGHLCILCRDEQHIGFEKPTMVLLAYIQRSAVLSMNRNERRIPNYALTPSNQLKHQFLSHMRTKSGSAPDMYSFTSDNSWSFDATFMPSDLFFGPHISTCGHVMHYECWQSFFDAILKRETLRPNRNTRHVSFELEKHEILCPLCECISNATIPLLPHYSIFSRRPISLNSPLTTIFSPKPETIERSSEKLSACLSALRGTVDMFKHIRHIKDVTPNVLVNHEDKYMRLMQPRSINEVLEELSEPEGLGLRDFINSMRTESVTANNCTKNLLCSISTLAERIHSVGLDFDKSVVDVHHARIFMMTSWSISYTIQAAERVSRFKGSPLFEELESSRNLCLTYLLRFACCSMLTHQADMLQSLLVRKLRYLLINDEHLSSSPCCLDIDAFETFVSLYILLQKLYTHIDETSQNQSAAAEFLEDLLSSSLKSNSSKTSSLDGQTYAWTTSALDHEYFRNLLHLMLILNMLQVIVSIQNELSSTASDGSTTKEGEIPTATQESSDYFTLYNFYREIVIAAGHPNSKIPIVDEKFATSVKARLLPFLRSCAIFFFHLSQIQPPKPLKTKSAFFEGKDFLNPQTDANSDEATDGSSRFKFDLDSAAVNKEFDAVCHYLCLPTNFTQLLQSKEARHLARAWLRHSRVLILIKSALPDKQTEATKVENEKNKPLSRNRSLSSISSQQVSATSRGLLSTSPRNSHLMSSASSLGSPRASRTELMPVKLIGQPHTVNRLIELPYDYSELVDKVSDFTCPSIKNEDSRTPTMCLVCGVMLCSQSYCCQRDLNNLASNYQQILKRQHDSRQQSSSSTVNTSADLQLSSQQHANQTGVQYLGGSNTMPPNAVAALSLMNPGAALLVPSATASSANLGSSGSQIPSSVIHQQLVGSCTYHTHECSGGVGVFLRVRSCQILFLSGRSKGCYMPAPYIDDHGETDFGLQRGNPLHLNRQHYEKLQQMWLTHAIPEQISRTLEYSPYASSINWHLH